MYGQFQETIRLGMKVRTVDGKVLGRVKSVHGDTFDIEKGVFMPKDHAAAFSEVLRIDSDGVVLSISERSFDEIRGEGGIGTSFSERASGVVDHARAAIDEAVHGTKSTSPKRPS